jgi:hypothetical protein
MVKYIYTLSFEGVVFYVGETRNPVARYEQHYADPGSKGFRIARYLLYERNIICKMDLIDVTNDMLWLWRLENKWIAYFSKYFYLVNHEITYRSTFHWCFVPVRNVRYSHRLEPMKLLIKQQQDEIYRLWQKKSIPRCGLLSNLLPQN